VGHPTRPGGVRVAVHLLLGGSRGMSVPSSARPPVRPEPGEVISRSISAGMPAFFHLMWPRRVDRELTERGFPVALGRSGGSFGPLVALPPGAQGGDDGLGLGGRSSVAGLVEHPPCSGFTRHYTGTRPARFLDNTSSIPRVGRAFRSPSRRRERMPALMILC